MNREILRLAVPAFFALVAEPLFLLVDSAVVGRLGVTPLAGLGAASAVLLTASSVFVFLAYGTTSVVARQVGAGSPRGALEAGAGGVWLALGLGTVAAVAVWGWAPFWASAFGSSPEALDQAVTYLRISALGLPAMLVVLAATGILRGLLDTRTPLVVATVGFTTNAALNVAFVLGLGWGIAGAAWGTVIAQAGMALALVGVILRHARANGASLRPRTGRVLAAALGGVPLLVRTLALRAIILLTVAAAATFGDVPLAAYQVTTTIWAALSFALDAIAIAGQALTGRALGQGDTKGVSEATRVMVRWGWWSGLVLGAGLLLVHPLLPALFTPDPAVQRAMAAGLVVVALSQPLAGYVFVVDGVLIGAGDGRWLAGAMVVVLAIYVPVVWLARELVPRLGGPGEGGGAGLDLPLLGTIGPEQVAVSVLWVAFTLFMVVRGASMAYRVRGDAWMVLGATR